MDQQSPDSQTSTRNSTGFNFFTRELYNQDDLPMVVWLRGDEPYCDSFSLNADQVMAELGVRRSRLTQISGRELRVGRRRDGRYIRPMFRPEDVEAYKSWSRAPATQAKSHHLVQEILDRMERDLNSFAELRDDLFSDFQKHIAPELTRIQSELSWQLKTLSQYFDAQILDMKERFLKCTLEALTETANLMLLELTHKTQDESRQIFDKLNEEWKVSMQTLKNEGLIHAERLLTALSDFAEVEKSRHELIRQRFTNSLPTRKSARKLLTPISSKQMHERSAPLRRGAKIKSQKVDHLHF